MSEISFMYLRDIKNAVLNIKKKIKTKAILLL